MAICKQCNKEFEAKRADAVYCSANCRVTANRVTDKSVTDNPPVCVTDNPYPGGPDCTCGMCKNKVINKSSKIINHGPYKTAANLKENEINRVPIPGDIDYAGVCHQDATGAWSC